MADPIRLNYHAGTLRFLGLAPRLSPEAVWVIERCEADCGARLPHLASLRLSSPDMDLRSQKVLSESDTLAWVSISCGTDRISRARRRARRLADDCPPLDAVLEQPFDWR
jgi:hypothetical protein